MSVFGDLERLIADLYPYRWPLTVGFVVAVAVAAWFAYGRGLHLPLLRHKLATGAAAIVLLAVAIPAGNYLLSPLWERSYVNEPSPIAAASADAAQPQAGSDAAPTPVPTSGSAAAIESPSGAPLTPGAAVPTAAVGEPATATEAPTGDAPSDAPGASPAPADPTPSASFEPHIVRRGQVTGADSFHFGEGTALLIEISPGRYSLRFEEFSVQNGPDLFVYLSPGEDGYQDGAINLGELRATDGAFNYDVPPEIDVADFHSAVVWCRQFAVEFASAPLAAVAVE